MKKRDFTEKYKEPDILRRRFLGAAAVGPLLCLPGIAYARSTIHQIEGEVYINNRLAKKTSKIKAGDQIVVAQGGKLAISMGEDAFLLSENTVLEIAGKSVVSGLRLLTGAVLSVFGKRTKPAYIATSAATIGIRGTGVYLYTEQPDQLYTCTCYGQTDLRVGWSLKEVEATHHFAHEVFRGRNGLEVARSSKMIGHSDDELRMLESYVGRKPKFDL